MAFDAAAAAAAMAGLAVSSKKPDLPAFDRKNVEIWIRRVENAYIRSGVRNAVEKFAFIEAKFGVDTDSAINGFLFGDATDERWTAFMAYLKKRYGRSVPDRAAAVIDRLPRDGRLPSEMAALLRDRAKGISLDLVFKEKILRELPEHIRVAIEDKVSDLDLDETMNIADKFFKQDGQLKFASAPVNAINSDVETEINAVRGGARPKQRVGGNSGGNANARSKSRGGSDYVHKNPDLCFFHDCFGKRAKNCRQPCKWVKDPNDQGPRRA